MKKNGNSNAFSILTTKSWAGWPGAGGRFGWLGAAVPGS